MRTYRACVMVETGGIHHVTTCLRSTDKVLRMAAAKSLMNLSGDESKSCDLAPVLPTLLACLRDMAIEEHFASTCAGVIRNASRREQRYRDLIFNASGLTALLKVLRLRSHKCLDSSTAPTCENVICTLWMLLPRVDYSCSMEFFVLLRSIINITSPLLFAESDSPRRLLYYSFGTLSAWCAENIDAQRAFFDCVLHDTAVNVLRFLAHSERCEESALTQKIVRACCSSLRPLSTAELSAKGNIFSLTSHFYKASIDVLLPIVERYADSVKTAETAVALLTNFAGFQPVARKELASKAILGRLFRLHGHQVRRFNSNQMNCEALCERMSQLLLNISVGMYTLDAESISGLTSCLAVMVGRCDRAMESTVSYFCASICNFAKTRKNIDRLKREEDILCHIIALQKEWPDIPHAQAAKCLLLDAGKSST